MELQDQHFKVYLSNSLIIDYRVRIWNLLTHAQSGSDSFSLVLQLKYDVGEESVHSQSFGLLISGLISPIQIPKILPFIMRSAENIFENKRRFHGANCIFKIKSIERVRCS